MFTNNYDNRPSSYHLILLTIFLLSVNGCASNSASNNVHYRIAQNKDVNALNRVLLLPAHIEVLEFITAGLSEPAITLSQQTNDTVFKSLKNVVTSELGLKPINNAPQYLNSDLTQHYSLLKQVLFSINKHATPAEWDVWPHKIAQFDYSIGNGLSFLKSKKIDAIVLTRGKQLVRTFRDELEFGTLFINTCVIDVKTGDLLWVDFSQYPFIDGRQSIEVNEMFTNIFKTFPQQLLPTNS